MIPPLLTIPLALGSGFLAARFKAVPRSLPRFLNRAVIWVLLPSLTFVQMHHLASEADAESLRRFAMPVSMAWGLFALAAAIFIPLGRFFSWDRKTVGSLILTAGLGNTAFIGYPVIQALYGEEGLRLAILTDQPGSFLVFSFLGVATAAIAAGKQERLTRLLSQLFWKLITFPTIWALVLGIVLRNREIPPALLAVLVPLGKSMSFVALVSVGFQWDPRELLGKKERAKLRATYFGLAYKLALAPAFFLLFYRALGVSGLDLRVIVLQSAMAPMVTAGILATEAGLDSRVVLLMVSLGIPLSFLTLPLWALLLKGF